MTNWKRLIERGEGGEGNAFARIAETVTLSKPASLSANGSSLLGRSGT